MAEKFITFPVGDLDGDNLPTTLDNAILHATSSLTGLTNDQSRRAFVLQTPSGPFTPTAAFTPSDDVNLMHWYNESSASVNGSNQLTVWNDLAGTMNLIPDASVVSDAITFNEVTRTQLGRTVVNMDGTRRLHSATNILNTGTTFAVHGALVIDAVDNTADAIIATFGGTETWQIDSANASAFNGAIDVSGGMGTDANASGGPFFGSFSTFSVIFNAAASTITLYINDSPVATVSNYSAPASNGDRLRLSNVSGANVLDCAWGELILTTSIDNRADYQAYLAAKWIP